MTYKEKLRNDHPGLVGPQFGGGCSGCPRDYGYEVLLNCLATDSCKDCWGRAAPETGAKDKKVVYIAGPITGVPEYYRPFEEAMDAIEAAGMIPLSPCWMPVVLPRERCIKIGLAMLEQADGALFLPGWRDSHGCMLEKAYCENTGKPFYGSVDIDASVARLKAHLDDESDK